MKKGLLYRIVLGSGLFLFISCLAASDERCPDAICFDVALEKEESGFLVKLFFSSKVDTSL